MLKNLEGGRPLGSIFIPVNDCPSVTLSFRLTRFATAAGSARHAAQVVADETVSLTAIVVPIAAKLDF